MDGPKSIRNMSEISEVSEVSELGPKFKYCFYRNIANLLFRIVGSCMTSQLLIHRRIHVLFA